MKKACKIISVLVSVCLIIVLVKFLPAVIWAVSGNSNVNLKLESTGSSISYGYDENTYVDFTIRNDGEAELYNVTFTFRDENRNDSYLGSICDAQNTNEKNAGFGLTKGQSKTFRAYVKAGLSAGSYDLSVDVEASYMDESGESKTVKNKISNTKYTLIITKKDLYITVPDKTVKSEEEISPVTVSDLLLDGLVPGDSLDAAVEGLRDTSYVKNEMGIYESEDISGEITSANYKVNYLTGKLIVEAEGNDKQENNASENNIGLGNNNVANNNAANNNDSKKNNTKNDNSENNKAKNNDLKNNNTENNNTENNNTNNTDNNNSENSSSNDNVADTRPPVAKLSSPDMEWNGQAFVSRSVSKLVFELSDGDDETANAADTNKEISGVKGIDYSFDNEAIEYVDARDDRVVIIIPEAFSGYVYYRTYDLAGNISAQQKVEIVAVNDEAGERPESEEGTKTEEGTQTEEGGQTEESTQSEESTQTEESTAGEDESKTTEESPKASNYITEKAEDITPPTVTVSSKDMLLLGDTFVGTMAGTIEFTVADQENNADELISGAKSISYSLNQESGYVTLNDSQAEVELPGDFSGKVYFYGEDNAGNISNTICVNIDIRKPVDTCAPTVTVSSENMFRYGSTYIMTATGGVLIFTATDLHENEAEDEISGVNYISYRMGDKEGTLKVENGVASLPLASDFQGYVYYSVTDNAGNTSDLQYCKIIRLEDTKESASDTSLFDKFLVPMDMSMQVDQYANENQITSDEYILENDNDFPITLTFKDLKVDVNEDNVTIAGIHKLKSLEVVVIADGQETRIDASASKAGKVYVQTIPSKSSVKIRFEGSIGYNSSHYWRSGDLNLKMLYEISR